MISIYGAGENLWHKYAYRNTLDKLKYNLLVSQSHSLTQAYNIFLSLLSDLLIFVSQASSYFLTCFCTWHSARKAFSVQDTLTRIATSGAL